MNEKVQLMKNKFSLLLLIIMLIPVDTFAIRQRGVELYHEYISPFQVKVHVVEYIDCFSLPTANFPFSPTNPPAFGNELTAYSVDGCTISPGTWQVESWADITPLCPGANSTCASSTGIRGLALLHYSNIYTISQCAAGSEVRFNFYRPYRNQHSFQTLFILNQLSFSLSLIVKVGTTNLPPILPPIPLSLCDSIPSSFFAGGLDPDADSLAYFLVRPPFASNSNYLSGKSHLDPFGPKWETHYDTLSGVLSFIPTSGGGFNGLFVFEIQEFKNDTLVGTYNRDLTISLKNCAGNSPPIISDITSVFQAEKISANEIHYCPGIPFSFTIECSDPDFGQQVSLIHHIDHYLPGAVVTQSGTDPVLLTVEWTPGLQPVDEIVLPLTIQDDYCTASGITAREFTFRPIGVCIVTEVKPTNCFNNSGSITVSPNGVGSPFSYQWSTGSTDSVISMLPTGNYWVDISDSSGVSVASDTFKITLNKLLLSVVETHPDCGVASGKLEVNPTGGDPAYSYQWSTGSSNKSISNLAPGGYTVLVENSAGCTSQKTIIMEEPDTCFVTVSGYVFHDLNLNCIKDPGETPVEGALINANTGGMVLSDSTGYYSLRIDTGLIQVDIKSLPSPASGCKVGGYSFYEGNSGSYHTSLDLGVHLYSPQDLETFLSSTVPTKEGLVGYQVGTINHGVFSASQVEQTLTFPAELEYLSGSPEPSSIDTVNNIITWEHSVITQSQMKRATAFFRLPTGLNSGDSLRATALSKPVQGDFTPQNNEDTVLAKVLSSISPNNKQAQPRGLLEEGYIPDTTSTLEYQINFQNDGEKPINHLIIRDTLSPFLDLSRYQTLGYSHPFSLTVEDDSIMVYNFSGSNFPDSASDPIASQGFIRFRIGIIQQAPGGSIISNEAATSFDYYPPVFTNTTTHTIISRPEIALENITLACEKDSLVAELVVPGQKPYTYEWSTGRTVSKTSQEDGVELTKSGWYKVAVTDVLGLITQDSGYVDVTNIPEAGFTWDFTGNGYQVSFVNTSTSGENYFWDFGDGNQNPTPTLTYSYSQLGTYEVSMIVSNECGADTALSTIDISQVGIGDWPYLPTSILPNPAVDKVFIQFPSRRNWQMALTDLRGKHLFSWEEYGDSSELSVLSFPSGLYFIEISDGEHAIRHKLLIEK